MVLYILVHIQKGEKMIKAFNIDWDFDDLTEEEIAEANCPNEIEIPEDIFDEEEISDYLSNVTGFRHKGFELRKK